MTKLFLSHTDYSELVFFAKTIQSQLEIDEVLIQRGVCRLDDKPVTPQEAAILITKSSPLYAQKDLVQMAGWFELVFGVFKPTFKTANQPNTIVFQCLEEALKDEGKYLLSTPAPTPVDWLVFAVVESRIGAAMIPSEAKKYMNVVKWGERLRAFCSDMHISCQGKPFDHRVFEMTAVKEALPDGPVGNKASKAQKPSGKQGTGNNDKKEDQQTIDPFARLDICVGKIVEVEKHPNADRLYIERVDFGEAKGMRTVVSGLVEHMPIEEMRGRLACFLCNLKPASICKTLSEGMILCGKQDGIVKILEPPGLCKPGDRVTVDGLEPNPDAQLKQKENIWPLVQEQLKVSQGKVIYTANGKPLSVNGELLTVDLEDGIVS